MRYFIDPECLMVHSIMAESHESSNATAGFSIVAVPPDL